MADYTLYIRPRRQATFPRDFLRQLGLEVGDSVQIKVEGDKAVLTPRKKIALNALKEIQNIFSKSEIPESQLQADLSRGRKSE